MLTEHILPQTVTHPSSGTVTAQVTGDDLFDTNIVNFAYDYYTTDKQLRLTLSTAQAPAGASGKNVMRGIEMVFNVDILDGKHRIEDKQVSATYWELGEKNGESRFQTYDADTGSIDVKFDHEKETYDGSFSFTSKGPGTVLLELTEGRFSITGRDNLTL